MRPNLPYCFLKIRSTLNVDPVANEKALQCVTALENEFDRLQGVLDSFRTPEDTP
jgi:hypothetical protein